VIFSTYGERECDMISHKISLLKSEAGGLIDMIFLSHRRIGNTEERTERMAKEADSSIEVIVNNSISVPDMDDEKGKGSDMRRAVYHINKYFRGSMQENDIILVFLDADVLPEYFGAHFVIGLAGAILEGYDFAKASFWRAMGRVKKYTAQPLYSLIDHPKINKLTGFAYPLSGEVAGTLEFFNSVNFWQIYGIETGMNIDSCLGGKRVADVNLGLYDHHHHGDFVIQQMSFGIIRTFFIQLIDNGILKLEDGAKISDVFKISYIDEEGERKYFECNLHEKKYQPLKKILTTSGRV
jgi:hypothetical protein